MDVRVIVCDTAAHPETLPDTLAGLMAWLGSKMEQIPEQFRKVAEYEFSSEYESSRVDVIIDYVRPETAEEEASRIGLEKARAGARAEAQRSTELAMLQALKAKYGDV